MVAVTYVRDIGASRAFYELLGFRQHSSGKADTSAWLALHRDGHYVLLASTRPPLDIPQLPLLFYGNTVLLGQRERSASQPPAADDEASPRFSLLKEAAALVEARGGTTRMCQVSDAGGAPCGKRAEVRLADAVGDTAWACLAHADEILVTVRGSFIASQDEQGIGWFLSRRRG